MLRYTRRKISEFAFLTELHDRPRVRRSQLCRRWPAQQIARLESDYRTCRKLRVGRWPSLPDEFERKFRPFWIDH